MDCRIKSGNDDDRGRELHGHMGQWLAPLALCNAMATRSVDAKGPGNRAFHAVLERFQEKCAALFRFENAIKQRLDTSLFRFHIIGKGSSLPRKVESTRRAMMRRPRYAAFRVIA